MIFVNYSRISEPYNADCTYNRFNSLKDAFEFILKKENL